MSAALNPIESLRARLFGSRSSTHEVGRCTSSVLCCRVKNAVGLNGDCFESDPNSPFFQAVQRGGRKMKGLLFRYNSQKSLPEGREKIVLLGTGWGSLYFLSQIDPSKFDVTVVSPRSFFVFTPLLTAALSGTLSIRSVMEPIRNKMFWGGRKAMEYLDATAEDVKLDQARSINQCDTYERIRIDVHIGLYAS